jgi:hypothetical protein
MHGRVLRNNVPLGDVWKHDTRNPSGNQACDIFKGLAVKRPKTATPAPP